MSIVEEIKKIVPNKRIKSSVDLIKKFKKEDVEKEIQTLETSKDQEDFNLSIILAFALGDKDRVFKGFSHNATSAKKTSVQCLSILSDEQLETIIFSSVKSIRKAILKKVRNNRTKLLEKLILSLLEKFGNDEALVLVPFLKNKELISQVLEKSSLKSLNHLTNQTCYKNRIQDVSFELFKKELQELKKNKNPQGVQIAWNTNKFVPLLYRKYPNEMLKLERETSPKTKKYLCLFKSHPDVILDILKKDTKIITYQTLKYVTMEQVSDIFLASIQQKNYNVIFNLNEKKIPKLFEILSKKVDVFELLKDLPMNLSKISTIPLEFSDKYFQYQLDKAKKTTGQKTEAELLQFYKYLDYSKVKTQLEDMLNTKDADFRCLVFSTIIFSGLRTPKEQKSVISLLEKKLKNEQDQVKVSVLYSLIESFTDKTLLKNVEFFDQVLTPFLYGVDRSQEIYKSLATISFYLLKHQYDSKEHMEVVSKWYKEIIKQANATTFNFQRYSDVKELNQRFLSIMKDPFKDFSKRGNVFFILSLLKFNTPLTCEYIEMILPRILLNDKKNNIELTRVLSIYLKDQKTRSERLKKILEIDPTAIALKPIQINCFSSNLSLLDTYLNINGPITWSSLNVNKGQFIQETENYYFNPVIIRQFKKSLPLKVKEKIEKLLILAIQDEFVKPNVKVTTIITIANLQLGPSSENYMNLIEELSGSLDQKIQQTAVASIQYSDLVNLEDIVKKMSPKNAKLLASSLSRMLLYSTQKEIDNFMKFLESDEFFKLQMTVQRELLNLLTQFPNQRSFDLIKKISKRENLEDNLKLILVFFATKYINQDPELWNIIELFKSSEYLPLVEKIFQVPFHQNSEETNQKFVKLQYEYLTSKILDIQQYAWSSINVQFVDSDKFTNLCIELLSDFKKEIPIALLQSAASKLIACIAQNEKVFEKVISLIQSYYKDYKEEIEGKRDQPLRSNVKYLVNSLQSYANTLMKLGHQKMIDEFALLVIKNDHSFFYSIAQIYQNLNTRQLTEDCLKYFDSIISLEKELSVQYPPFYLYMSLDAYYIPRKLLEEVCLKLFEKNSEIHAFLALKLIEINHSLYESSVEHVKKARKSENIVISTMASNISLESVIRPQIMGERCGDRRRGGSPFSRGRGGW